jgi:hypothetical protein
MFQASRLKGAAAAFAPSGANSLLQLGEFYLLTDFLCRAACVLAFFDRIRAGGCAPVRERFPGPADAARFGLRNDEDFPLYVV